MGLITAFLCSLLLFLVSNNLFPWHSSDHALLDHFYTWAVQRGHGPQPCFSPEIRYLVITEDSYEYLGANMLDRASLASINLALHDLEAEGIIYDLIFARPSNSAADQAFMQSIAKAGKVYLPMAFTQTKHAKLQQPSRLHPRHVISGQESDSSYSEQAFPTEINPTQGQPFYGGHALQQYSPFAQAAAALGNITALADPDSTYRHTTMLTKTNTGYVPALALAVFMDWAGISMQDLHVEWGKEITLTARPGNTLERDVHIPIDMGGQTFTPYLAKMGQDFRTMSVHHFLDHAQNPDLRGNLRDFFAGNFVLIGDISAGTSDLGHTPLEGETPLLTIHAALLNALLTNTFYARWPRSQAAAALFLLPLILGLAACQGSAWWLYCSGLLLATALPLLTWYEILHFRFLPLASMYMVFWVSFFSLLIFLQVSTARERSFIRTTFSRYVPRTVVDTLLAQPEMISLGGEEREVSILFADLAGFTSIAERLSPADLVYLLNDYFTEMEQIITAHNGIIDKFQGDAIMAEFGMPIPDPKHAEQAVSAALDMQQRLKSLRQDWQEQGRPALHCRIGINTGTVIAGNMGSRTAMDYTVMGDAVNLASRLEGANKYYDTSIIISEFTLAQIEQGKFSIRILDYVKVKGKQQPVKIYEPYACKGYLSDHPTQYYTLFDKAFHAYLAGDFLEAEELFRQAQRLYPQDLASIGMQNRLHQRKKQDTTHKMELAVSLA